MYYLDKNASESPPFPKWFMTLVSLYGLGFQLLLMSLMLILNLQDYVIPFFIIYSILILVFVGIRKRFIKPS
jgi:CDP-diacylglycerol--serine O-phosphatidyltransferase